MQKPVSFEIDFAQCAFDERALNAEARNKAGTGGLFAIPFLLWWSTTKTLSPSAWYNDQIAVCDSDKDGWISQREAVAFNPEYGRTPVEQQTADVQSGVEVHQTSGTAEQPRSPMPFRNLPEPRH